MATAKPSRKSSLFDLVGLLSKGQTDELERRVRENRKRREERLDRIAEELRDFRAQNGKLKTR